MINVRTYILSILFAAIISGIVTNLFPKKSAQSALIQMLAGIFITVTVISPWKKIQFSGVADFIDTIEIASSSSVTDGSEAYNQAVRSGIIDRAEAYVLEKAALLGADLEISVSLSNSTPATPVSAKISGKISPFAKKQLVQIMINDLGIPEESQIWS